MQRQRKKKQKERRKRKVEELVNRGEGEKRGKRILEVSEEENRRR